MLSKSAHSAENGPLFLLLWFVNNLTAALILQLTPVDI